MTVIKIGGQPFPRRLFVRLHAVAFAAAAVFFTPAQAQPLDPPLCERTPEIQAAVLALTPEDDGCADFAAAALRSATLLDAGYRGIGVLQAEDFNDMDALETLDLSNNRLQALPDGMFSELDTLLTLNLRSNRLRELAADVFDGAAGLKRLDLRDNRLEYMPPRIFENVDLGLSATAGAGGSLLLSGNPGLDGDPQTPFAFVVDITVANPRVEAECNRILGGNPIPSRECSSARTVHLIDFGLYLAQGAPFDISVQLTAENYSFDSLEQSFDNDTGLIHASYSRYLNIELDEETVEIRSSQVHATNPSLEEFRHSDRRFTGSRTSPAPQVSSVAVSIEVPPTMPDGNCGYSPCYDGFEISGGADVLYERRGETEGAHRSFESSGATDLLYRRHFFDRNRIRNVNWPRTVVTAVNFSNPPHRDGYIAGLEAVTVEVVFDRKMVVVEGKPLLKLEVGDRERDAAYVPSEGASDRLRFRYRFSPDDLDSDGIRVMSLDSSGATIGDMLVGLRARSPNLSLECCDDVVAAQKVRQVRQLSFDAASVSAGEGETADLSFTLSPPPTNPLTVNFSVGESDDVDVDGGTVEVPANAETGTIRIQINDDEVVEPARETFTVSLEPSGGYIPGVHSVVEVEVEEGVCDRKTPAIREALIAATGRGDCAAVSADDLFLVSDLDLSSLGIDRLHARDFLGLARLASLNLQDNALQVLPAEVFEGLAQLGGPSGSLLLDGNPGAPFDLTVEVRIVETTRGTDQEDVTFEFYLAQGAPLDVAFEWDFHPPAALRPGGADPTGDFSIPAGGTRSRPITLTIGRVNTDDEPLGVQLGDLPALPSGDSGCGHDPCYAGFRFATPPTYGAGGGSLTDAHLIYVRDPPRPTPRVTRVGFSAPQSRGSYVAGVETITVEVEFDEILFVELPDSGDGPLLSLDVGGRLRTATYVLSGDASTVLRFEYATRDDDFDADGVSVASADGFELNGAVVTGRFGKVPDFSLSSFLAPAAGHGVRRAEGLSFHSAEVSVEEGDTLELVFYAEPPPPSVLTVAYVVVTGGVEERGNVQVSAAAGSGVIRLQIEDDEDIEPADDGGGFEVRLAASGGYSPISPSRVAVTVREGVCDRTPEVQEALTTLAGRGDCAEVTGEDLVGMTETLDLNGQGVTVLQPKDFSELTGLQTLDLSTNALTYLPVGVFAGLGGLNVLDLRRNQLETLQLGVFAGLADLRRLELGTNALKDLPVGVFSELGELNNLSMQDNELETLRVGVFDGLSKVIRLRLPRNRLTSLPAGVFAGVNRNIGSIGQSNLWLFLEGNRLSSLSPGVFSGLDGLNWLNLDGNALEKLPPGAFSGMPSSLRVFDLRNNPGADFSLVPRVEFAGGPEAPVSASGETVPIKVTLREGAPYELTVDIGVSEGQASVSTVEIPAGGTQSETFTLTRDAGAVRTEVSLTTITSSPPNSCLSWQRVNSDQCFNGLEISLVESLPLVLLSNTAESASPPVCDRTPEIRDAILRLWDGDDCMSFPASILRIVPSLDVSGTTLTSFKSTDFNNMEVLEALDLSGNDGLQTLGSHAFGGQLRQLKRLDLSASGLSRLHARTFFGMAELEQLLLHDNDLSELPPNVFGSLALGEPSGSLRLDGNLEEGSPGFALTANFVVDSFAGDEIEFHLYLAQGASFDVTFPLTAEGAASPVSPSVTISSGSTQSVALNARRQSGQALRLNLGDPPAAPPGDSGCGYIPCYAGFEIAAGTPLVFSDSSQASPVVVMAEFTSSPRHSGDAYVAGLETIIVDLVFNEGLTIDVSGGAPSLNLMVGSRERTAIYVRTLASSSDRLRFSYALTRDDSDDDGVSIASSSGLQLNGAVVENRFGAAADTMLPSGVLSAFPGHKVRRISLVSFDAVSVSSTEGSTAELPLRFNPPTPLGLTVRYRVGGDGDTAGPADYTDPGAGRVSVPAGAAGGAVRISIRDDSDAEPPRESFTVSLAPSGDYLLGADAASVIIKEGVCDRTARISTTLTMALNLPDCAEATTADLSGLRRLDAGSLGISSLKREDFSGLTRLESLWLHDNSLQTLPAGVFSDLGELTALWLHENDLTELRSDVFSESTRLRTLNLSTNRLTVLPDGVFSGLAGLAEVNLSANDGSTFILAIKTEPPRFRNKFTSAEVKLVLREGAPYPITVSLAATGATLSSPASLTIPAGRVESDGMVTVTRTSGDFVLTLGPPSPSEMSGYPGIMIVTESPSTSSGVELRLRLFLEGALE